MLDELADCPPFETAFPAETEGELGHGAGVLRYMRQFEQCLVEDGTPTPDVRDGAKSIAVCAAAWESIRQGGVVHVRNEF